MTIAKLYGALVCGAAVLAAPARAGLDMNVYETDDLQVITYTKDHEDLVPHVVRSFENSLRFHKRLFAYDPSEKVVVLLHDFGDYGHGGTSTVPWNYVSIGIEPFDYVYETMPANERINWLAHHELVHVVATDQAAGPDLTARRLFRGKVAPTTENPVSMAWSYLASPRWYAPRWYHEGIAVFLETWMSGGVGRVLGGYDEMVFRTLAIEGRPFWSVVGLESEGTAADFQVGQNSYLYGTRFVTWLAVTHGPEKLLAWFKRDDGSRRYFSSQFEQVYGMPLDEAWAQWIAAEARWQQANLERIRTHPVTEDRPVLNRTLGSVSRTFIDREAGKAYMAVNYPATPAHIAAIDIATGRMERLADITGPALYYVSSLAFDPASRRLFYTTDNTSGWRDLNELDLASGRSRRLLKDCRTGDLVVNPSDHAIWGVQHHNGRSSIVRFQPPYDAWGVLATLPYGKDVFDLDISPDGRILTAAMIEVDGRQRLVKLDTERLAAGDSAYEVLHEFENNAPLNFTFSPDGLFLYGTSFYSGVSNVFRFDLANRRMEAVTNAETGYVRPQALGDGRLFAFRYTADGFVPVVLDDGTREDVEAIAYLGQEVAERHPVVTTWNAGSPLKVDLEDVKRRAGPYRAGRSMRLASVYPIVEGYRDFAAVGVRMNVADPVAMHNLDVTVSGTPDAELPDNERLHVQANYTHWPWKVRAGHNAADFYDLFGPTKTSRKGTYLGAGYEGYLLNERPRVLQYMARATGYMGLDTLPQYQNVAAAYDKYWNAAAMLAYGNLRGTIGGVEAERGLSWSLVATNNQVKGRAYPRAYTDFDLGIPLPLAHSSLWLRSSVGYSWGVETSSFSNFYFGGFGNNWVDHLAPRRYRESYAFPGVDLNAIEANNYAKLTVEWTAPPVRFRSVGRPGFYVNWMQAILFTQGIRTNLRGALERRDLTDIGAQVDFKVVFFSNLESTISFGYARAYEGGREVGSEFMGSLKILR